MNLSRSKLRHVLTLATSDALYSWPLAIWVTAIGGTIGLASRYDFVPASNYLTTAVVAGSAIPMFTFIFVCWHIFLRRLIGRGRIAATLIVFFLGGLLRVSIITLYVSSYTQDVSALGNVPLRMVAYALFMESLLLLSTYVVAMSRRHRAKTELVIAQRTQVDRVMAGVSQAIGQDQARVTTEVQGQLEAELSGLAGESPEDLVVRAKELTDELVRPLSHKLARAIPQIEVPEVDEQQFEVSWSAFWRKVHFERFLRPGWFCIPVVFLILVSEYFIFSEFPLVGYVVAVPVLAIGLSIANLGIRNLGSLVPLARYVIAVIVLALVSAPAAWVVAYFSGPDQNQSGIFLVFVVEAVVLTLLASVALGLTETFDRMDRELDGLSWQLAWTQARGQGTLWFQNGQLAQALHGPIQSELHVALHELRQSLASPQSSHSRELAAQGTSHVADRLMTTIPELLGRQREAVPFVDAIAQSRGLWQGQAAIELVATDEAIARLDGDPVASSLAIEICQEAISNAVRHGRASQVDLDLSAPEPDLVALVVVDNGSGEWSTGKAGLGMARLRECALDWSLDQLENGARLRAVLPVE